MSRVSQCGKVHHADGLQWVVVAVPEKPVETLHMLHVAGVAVATVRPPRSAAQLPDESSLSMSRSTVEKSLPFWYRPNESLPMFPV